MGHTEREREMLSLSYKALGLETLSRKTRGQKAAKQSFSSHVFCSIRERESWRDERRETREGYAHGHTHTHTHTEREFLKRE